MKLTILPFLTLQLATNTISSQAAKLPNSDPLTVRTATGTFTGLIDPAFPNTRQFRAIPFAEPPVQSRRWLPPKKLRPSNKHVTVKRFSPSCPQFVSAVPIFYNVDFTRGNTIYNPGPNGEQNDTSGEVGTATSEDCLFLAIWTPKVTAPRHHGAGLPVLFFMTGGGFVMGGIDIPWQMPTSWVERSQSHIVVTINYRVDILGFPYARGLQDKDQNLGILDQRAALEWVRDNIAAFGGDPNRITQMGRSAGAFSADIHAYAFPKDPIAQAYYMQSGTIAGAGVQAQDPPYTNFTFVARHFGCDRGGKSDEKGITELDCMRNVSFKDLINFIGQYNDRREQPALRFNLVPDERTVFSSYKERSEAGNFARRPVLLSNTANEASTFFLPPDLMTAPDQAVVTAADLSVFVCPTFNSTVYRNRVHVPVFRFQHAGTFPNLNVYPWLGAWHASDIPMTFGTYHLLDHIAATTQFEIDVSRSMQDHILAFVKDPYNGPQRTMGWKPMVVSEPNGGDLIRFGAQGVVAQHVDGVEVDGACQGIGEYNPFP